jgi:hypothetical protein
MGKSKMLTTVSRSSLARYKTIGSNTQMVEETGITITRTSSSGERTSNMTTIKGQGLHIKQAVRRLTERQMITTETIGIASSEKILFI